jgi:tetratricopeptide (TPR) repeat protein
MDEQWSRAKQMLNDLLEADPDDPEAWLDHHCDDPDLRIEVESLRRAYQQGTLSTGDEAAGWLGDTGNWSPDGLGAEADEPGPRAGRADESDPLGLTGKRVGGYRVEGLVGSGGMGIVYQAHDPKLGRRVALKFLPSHLARRPEAEERFLREAQAASALEHSHIATVYEVGQVETGTAAGQRFITMAYYEGHTLEERLDQEGSLPIEEAVGYAEQIADALARAHEAGIVHRDVKPANVMVTEAGTVKLLDFGIAKAAAETRLTGPEQALGTTAYMSPEQARGTDVDGRADLWALGVVLYEMLTGERPFGGERSAAVLHSIRHEPPTPLSEERRNLPSALEQAVHRCLQKEPEERYDSAEALLDDLRALRSGAGAVGVQSSNAGGLAQLGRGWLGGAVAVLLVGLAGAASWVIWSDEGGGSPTTGAGPGRSVAVLPFEVSGEGAQAWRDGMVTMLSMNLDGAGDLRAIPDRRVFAAAEQVDSAAVEAGRSPALAVAERADARYAVVGSAVQLGETLRLGAEVFAVDAGTRLGRVEVEGAPDRITTLTDRLTRRVLDVLLEKSEDRMPTVDLASITTSSLDALKAFLDGERHFRTGDFEAAIEDFESAVEMDSTFASAYVRLAISRAYAQVPGFLAPIRRAYRLADRLPRRERRLLRAGYLYAVENREYAAIDSARQLTQDYPDDPTAWYYLGEFLTAASIPRGLPEAERAHEKAVELDPGVTPYRYNLANLAFSLHQDSALASRRIETLPDRPLTDFYRTLRDLNFGSPSQQEEAWARLDTLTLAAGWEITLRDALAHPADWTLKDRVLGVLAGRKDVGAEVTVERFVHKLEGGRVDAALSAPPAEPEVGCELIEHRTLGYPIPDSTLRTRLSPSGLGSDASSYDLECTGLYLIERGDGDELGPVLARLRQIRDRPEASPRTETAADQALRTLEGYRAYRAGSLRVAAKHWAEFSTRSNERALWRGDLYRKLDRLKKAEGWYLAAWDHPLAHERLGRLYEQMDRPAEAQAAYRRFLAAWDGADPELQGWVDDARERLRALRTETPTE